MNYFRYLLKSKPITPSSNLYKIEDELDIGIGYLDDIVLKRYETIYRTLLARKICKPLDRMYTIEDIGRNIQGTIIDWCTSYALQGNVYIDEIINNINYTIFQSSLLFTISLALFIDPPALSSYEFNRGFSATCGFAAFSQIVVIISCTIVIGTFNRMIGACDSMVMRIYLHPILVFIFTLNYLGDLATLAAMCIAGFSRVNIDGYVQLYSLMIVIGLLTVYIRTSEHGKKYQDIRTFGFYSHYCDSTGRLKPEYLQKIYYPKSKKSK